MIGTGEIQMSSFAFRTRMREAFDHIVRGTPVHITHYKKPCAVLVPIGWYEQAQELIGDATQNDE